MFIAVPLETKPSWRSPPWMTLLLIALIFRTMEAFKTFDIAFVMTGQPQAELIFPIRSDATLVATWRIGPRWQHRKLTAQQSKAINLRTAQSADRWVFAQRNEPWVMALCGGKE